jgi:hypothetical protein
MEPTTEKRQPVSDVQVFRPLFFKSRFNVVFQSMPRSQKFFFPSDLQQILWPTTQPFRACYINSSLILLDLITLIIFSKDYKL